MPPCTYSWHLARLFAIDEWRGRGPTHTNGTQGVGTAPRVHAAGLSVSCESVRVIAEKIEDDMEKKLKRNLSSRGLLFIDMVIKKCTNKCLLFRDNRLWF